MCVVASQAKPKPCTLAKLNRRGLVAPCIRSANLTVNKILVSVASSRILSSRLIVREKHFFQLENFLFAFDGLFALIAVASPLRLFAAAHAVRNRSANRTKKNEK